MHTTHFLHNEGSGNAIETAYYDIGAGTPFVLVHGFTGSKLDFANRIGWFADGHRVLALDQRGHGESSNQGPYDLNTLCDDIFGFLDALDIGRCHLLGHSMGGMVAIHALLRAPGRFASAILMDTTPYPLGLFDDKTRAQLAEIINAKGCVGLFEGMQHQPVSAVEQRGVDYLGAAEHWRRIRVKLEQMDGDAFIDLTHHMEHFPSMLEEMKTLSVPTTILVGAKDKPFIKPSKAMQRALPDANLEVIAKAAHCPQYENADAWRQVVADHLEAVHV